MKNKPQKHSKLYIRVYNIVNFIIGTPRDSRRRKWARYGMFLLLYLLLAVLLGRNITSRHYPWYANISVFLLLNINILLALVLFVVLFRNLAKLMADRRKKIFGSRLQTKLIIFIVLLVTVPVFTTYFMSSSFIQNSIDRWFDSNVRQLANVALNLTENTQKSQIEELTHITESISEDLVVERSPDMIMEYLDKSIVNGLAVYGRGGYVYTQQNVSGALFDFVNSRLVDNVMAGDTLSSYELDDPRPYYWVGLPVYESGEIVGAIFAVRVSSINVVNDMKAVSELFFLFQQLRFFSPPVEKAFMVSYFLISMLVIFASIWGSVVFIRSITVPLQSLTKAAGRLSKGESDARVEVTGNDELTLVSNSFNDMAEKLQQHTHQLQQTNSELNEALSQIDTIYRNVDSSLILFDKNLNILKMNEHADDLTGDNEKLQKIILKLTTDFLTADLKEQAQSFVFENTQDDTRQYTAAISKIYDTNGELENILLVIDDNTHLMNMQRVTLWKEVASRLAHEIKNPLTPIKLTAERVKRRSKDVDDMALQELINKSMDMIVTESDELLTLVEEFSIYARMPSLIREDTNLLAIVEEVIALQKRLNTEVAMDMDIDVSIVLKCDKHQLKRVLVNLIQNSIQAMEGRNDGRISISASVKAGKVEIIVHDNGSGIKDEDMEKIFVPYFSKKPSGTGLGLAIIKKIIEEHGGTIFAKSKLGEFTQFNIVLPIG